MRDRIPGDEPAKQSFAAFSCFGRGLHIGAAIGCWDVHQAGPRVVAHRPPVVNRPLPTAALRCGNPHRPPRRQVNRGRPYRFDERLRGKKFPRLGVEHEKEAVLRRGHGHVVFLAVDHQIRHNNVIVFGMDAFGAGLIMPGVFSRVCVHRDDALAK